MATYRNGIVVEGTVNIKRLLLASKSEIRAHQLRQSGIDFDVLASEFDEKKICGSSPMQTALERAVGKALWVAERNPDKIVLGADQVLEFEGKHYGKVYTADDALERLEMLQGKKHQLHSAFCLLQYDKSAAKPLHQQVVSVGITFRKLETAEIRRYVASNEWVGSCGCYQFENKGVHLVDSVEGDWDAILGLPVLELTKALREVGIDPLSEP